MCDLNAKYKELKHRAQCKKHNKSLSYKAVPLTTSSISLGNNEAHNIEGDHMVDMLKHNIYSCKATDDVKMHHTKCTNISINVLCPHYEKELTDDIGSNKLSF